jgi:hypothetical protein
MKYAIVIIIGFILISTSIYTNKKTYLSAEEINAAKELIVISYSRTRFRERIMDYVLNDYFKGKAVIPKTLSYCISHTAQDYYDYVSLDTIIKGNISRKMIIDIALDSCDAHDKMVIGK